MVTRCWNVTMVTLIMVTLVLTACAKRPATTAASAPAPTGAAGTTGSTPPTSPTTPATARPGGGGAAPAAAAPTSPAAPGAPGGAPSQAVAARPEPKEFRAIPELKPIYFDFDKYDVRPADAKILDSNAAWLKTNAAQLVLIEGHCDERGTNEYNLALGERRAKATMNYLVSQGVQASRITVISYGEERPVCTEKNEACWAKNRRAQLLVKPQ
jgi:peptidoglycan-associated lipoprotein